MPLFLCSISLLQAVSMNRRVLCLAFFVMMITTSVGAQKRVTISSATLKNLVGCWQGTMNYSSTIIRKPYTTTAELIIRQLGKSNKFEVVHVYTKDPRENVIDTIIISKDCRKLNNASIKTKRTTRQGSTEIITTVSELDHDNNKPATVKRTYTLGKNLYTYKKQVQLQGQSAWLDREEFTYTRKACDKATK
jgi:hypothetical protein